LQRIFFISAFLFFFSNTISAQTKDSIAGPDSIAKQRASNKKLYSGPRRASILSAIIPGAGQVYNKKYWKLPLIYAGLGGFGYMFYFNNDQYNMYRSDLRSLVNDPSLKTVRGYDQSQLQTQKLYYKKFRDFAIIALGAVYILNIVDANVDAHLKTFDVSDDLSLSIDPLLEPVFVLGRVRMANGICIKLSFE
jgi:hypothetical protein